jgi:hypothetical protein
VDVAVTARHLVLYPERQFRRRRSVVHDPIVFLKVHPPQDLTNGRFSGSGDTDAQAAAPARRRRGTVPRLW